MKKVLLAGLLVCLFAGSAAVMAAEKAKDVTEIIIDNSGKEGFVMKGQWMTDEGQGGQGFGTDSLWAMVNPKGSDIAWWRPNLPKDGYYDVSLWYCGDPNNDHATNAPFIVAVNDKETKAFAVDLKKDFGKWNSLGVFKCKKGDKAYVSTNSGGNGNAIADAVKFTFLGTKKPK